MHLLVRIYNKNLLTIPRIFRIQRIVQNRFMFFNNNVFTNKDERYLPRLILPRMMILMAKYFLWQSYNICQDDSEQMPRGHMFL